MKVKEKTIKMRMTWVGSQRAVEEGEMAEFMPFLLKARIRLLRRL
jgi:hypothetical protein